jgi:pyruvate dehydrogenase E2 component (dihydrolipoamide acetyltransferase)
MTTRVILPQLELTMENVSVVRTLVKDGDLVAVDQPLLEVETQKALSEVPAPCAGYVRGFTLKPGDIVSEKCFLCFISTTLDEALPDPASGEERPGTAAKPPQDGVPKPDDGVPGPGVRATPAARKLARDLNIDITRVQPGGAGQRIEVEDVRAFGAATAGRAPEQSRGEESAPPWIDFSASRLALNAQMVRSLTEIPQIVVSRQLDVSKLGVRPEGITLTHVLIARIVVALGKHPALRTVTDGKRYRVAPVSVAVAMDSPAGLVAPVLRGPDLESVERIATRVRDLRRRAEQRALHSDELRDAPFALTNLGMLEVDQFSPLVFHGQTAVLAVGRIAKGSSSDVSAWFSLATDHRVVDGAEAARFLQTLQEALRT